MSNDDDFTVRVGRIGNRAPKAPSYARRLRIAIAREGHGGPDGRGAAFESGRAKRPRSSFTGARTGRGYAYGALASSRRPASGERRVVVKARLVRLKAGDLGAARAHLRYIQRDGVTREGNPGKLYDRETDQADAGQFAGRGVGDRHHFRFIVAPEDAGELADLKPFVRDLMRQMESDLGTQLDWVAADHFNTGHPHTHVVLRGKDDAGQDLVIARDYIAHGLRARAADLVTRELGPETEIEAARKIQQEISAERFTRLDRTILRDAPAGILEMSRQGARDGTWHAARMGRLRTLERMGLVEEAGANRWLIRPGLATTLRRMGERGDIIKAMHREIAAAGLSRSVGDYSIFDPEGGDRRLVGRIVGEGFSDELQERRYVVLDGVDGRTHYAEIGYLSDRDEPPIRNTIVELRSRTVQPREIDRTIATIAAIHDGRYSDHLHRVFDPQASDEYVASHVRRLEAFRHDKMVSRHADGSWSVGEDYLDRAHQYEDRLRLRSPVRIAVLSRQRLEDLPQAVGATWLDHQLIAKPPEVLGANGLGAEVETVMRARRQWLIEQGLAREQNGQMNYTRDLLRTLEARELQQAAADITARTGRVFVEIGRGGSITGVYRRKLTLNSGPYALIERSGDFALVPWRPVLERVRGELVTGTVGGEGVSWSIGQKRSLGL